MGDRASISFRNKKTGDESVAFFDHWGSDALEESARNYISRLKKHPKFVEERGTPLGRLEPGTVMVNFIRYYLTQLKQEHNDGTEYQWSSVYVEKDQNLGDNSDRGHAVIDL